MPSQLPTEPVRRLQQLSLDDTDDIYRLRLSGTNRLYGFLFGAVFYLLWWDPGHAVYPSTPRNT